MAELVELLRKVELGASELTAAAAAEGLGDPFKCLVATILSQNTNDRNSSEAFRRLEERVGVDPLRLARAPVGLVEEAIRPAGLYKRKAATLRNVARLVLELYGGDLWNLLRKPWREARRKLMELPGVGPKTADVVLASFVPEAEVVPVDTHVNRVAKRLGVVPPTAGYDEVSSKLAELVKGRMGFFEAHLRLIAVGRRYCRPRAPRCAECPLRGACAWAGRHRSRQEGA